MVIIELLTQYGIPAGIILNISSIAPSPEINIGSLSANEYARLRHFQCVCSGVTGAEYRQFILTPVFLKCGRITICRINWFLKIWHRTFDWTMIILFPSAFTAFPILDVFCCRCVFWLQIRNFNWRMVSSWTLKIKVSLVHYWTYETVLLITSDGIDRFVDTKHKAGTEKYDEDQKCHMFDQWCFYSLWFFSRGCFYL